MIENQNPSIPNNDDCGLFIGVDDYRAYEESAGQKAGRSCLPGSVNDAKAFWRLARTMGMRLDNLRILTSPPLQPADLGEGATSKNVGRATREGIEQGVRWLADCLGASSAIAGLLTYSGHGAYVEDGGLVVCPSDTRATAGGGLENVLPYSRLGELLGPAGRNLTTVLDCCHSGAASDQDDAIPSLGRLPVPESVTAKDMAFAGRVLAACGPQQVTQQALFLGVYHGAFTWAIASVLAQWKTVPDGDGRRATLAYGELVARAAQLVRSLALRCAPQVQGPDNVRQLAVMQRGDEPADTSVSPDGWRRNLQMDPGDKTYRWYSVHYETGTQPHAHIANVLVPRVDVTIDKTTYRAGTEYWFNVVTSVNASAIHFCWLDYASTDSPPFLGTQSFTMPRVRTDWSSQTPSNDATTYVNNETGIALTWALTYDQGARRWNGHLTWYAVTQQQQNAVFHRGTPGGGDVQYRASTAANVDWYCTDVPPTNG
jgi:hypothetical protein